MLIDFDENEIELMKKSINNIPFVRFDENVQKTIKDKLNKINNDKYIKVQKECIIGEVEGGNRDHP